MHAHGEEVAEEGSCKKTVRGDLHCRHKPKERPQRHDNENAALNKALRGIGEGSVANPNSPKLRKFPAPSHNHPAPQDHDDNAHLKAPAPKSSNAPAPDFNA